MPGLSLVRDRIRLVEEKEKPLIVGPEGKKFQAEDFELELVQNGVTLFFIKLWGSSRLFYDLIGDYYKIIQMEPTPTQQNFRQRMITQGLWLQPTEYPETP